MSKILDLEERFDRAMEAARKLDEKNGLPATVHGIPARGDYYGTCQACFGEYVVKQATTGVNRGKLVVVLHGYQRPGHGYIVGECPGRNEEPFQIAKDVTLKFQRQLTARVRDIESFIKRLRAGEIHELTIEVRDLEERRVWGVWGPKPKMKLVTISRDKPHPIEWGSFEDHIRRKIRDEEFTLREIEGHLKHIAKMLASWKYQPEALIGSRARAEAVTKAERESRHSTLVAERSKKQGEQAAKRKVALDRANGKIDVYLAQPAFVDFLKGPKARKGYIRGQEVSQYDYIMGYVNEGREPGNRDAIYRLRWAVQYLEASAKDARGWGVKVVKPK
jgi:hypothetical protein